VSAAQQRFRLDGHVALVTGASNGLGSHFAALLSDAGARVVLVSRRKDRLDALANSLKARGGDALAVAMDVTDAHSVRGAFDELCRWSIPDIIVNNAGISIARPLLDQSVDDFDKVMETNLRGPWLVATEGARRLVAAGMAGTIVNVASILGERVAAHVVPYAMSKAGILHGTRAMALELARHRIRVNSLLPGYIETDLNRDFLRSEAGDAMRQRIPSRRFGTPADLDGAMLLLCSDAGSAMSGACIAVDGAHLVSSL
jgi:NAD(P)-dependent dehydrogenase (short-subunit alcohol dehydrogenase family)